MRKLLLLCASVVIIGFNSCSKENGKKESKKNIEIIPETEIIPENLNPRKTPKIQNVSLALSKIDIISGDKKSIAITKGSGSYKVKSSEVSIARAIVKDLKVKVSAMKVGMSTITVVDLKTNKTVRIEVNVTPNAQELETVENKRILKLLKSYSLWSDNKYSTNNNGVTNELSFVNNTLTITTVNKLTNIKERKKYSLKNPAISRGKINTYKCQITDLHMAAPPITIERVEELGFTLIEDKNPPYHGHKLKIKINRVFVTLSKF